MCGFCRELMLVLVCFVHYQYSLDAPWPTESLKPALELLHQEYCTIPTLTRGKLFNEWSFSNKSPLLQFPTDPEEKNYVRKVSNVSFSHVTPIPFHSAPVLAALSSSALHGILNLDPCDCALSQGFLVMASGGHPPPPNSLYLAHRYGGHQFGYWSGQLGDGRAVLLGSYVNQRGEYWEAQLKGSGKTPYSRGGDGRAVVRSSIREFLASEAMHSLGIPTSRAASLVVSNERAWRDQFYSGNPRQELTAIVLRLAPSWFRIGSLEILHYNQEYELLQQTVDFVIDRYFPNFLHMSPSSRYAAFFAAVVNQTAEMIAQWQGVGFTHGVCNTDNFSLLSLTIDYGPFGFMEQCDLDFVPNTSDDEGRYRYQYQPSVGYYNLMKLLEAMKSLLKEETAKFEAERALLLYAAAFNDAFLRLMAEKLGLEGIEDVQQVEVLVTGLLRMMEDQKTDFTMTFRELSEITMVELVTDKLPGDYWALPRLLAHDAWRAWLLHYHSVSVSLAARTIEFIASYAEGLRRERLQKRNPRYVLRNWMAEEAIRKAEVSGDFSIIHKLHRVLRNPFRVQREAEESGYSHPPPPWAHELRVSCSS